ncbi:hypothetical protein DL96DRAFT_1706460 [Flagelloscypha sp. PMI_526]|nr:hypothetical protein DL96DRAFT_1706460 [Flagelloscypha sp. PMI_526]
MVYSSKLVALMAFVASVAAQCQQQIAYIEISNKATGAGKASLNSLCGLQVSTSTTSSDLLQVQRCNTCGADPNFLRIVDTPNTAVRYVGLIDGVTSCAADSVFGATGKWAVIAPHDGFPHGTYPTPGSTVTTVHQGGRWSNTGTLCGESMVFQTSGSEIIPTWRNPDGSLLTLVVVYDQTNNILSTMLLHMAAAPSLAAYGATSNAYEARIKLV